MRSILHSLDYPTKDKERIGAIDPKIVAERKALAR